MLGSSKAFNTLKQDLITNLKIDKVYDIDCETIYYEDLDNEKIKLIKTRVRKNCSSKHVPAIIIKVPEIPRTKSGKIVELAVRKLINGEELNNKEAIANPESLDFFKNLSQLKI